MKQGCKGMSQLRFASFDMTVMELSKPRPTVETLTNNVQFTNLQFTLRLFAKGVANRKS